MRTLRCNPLRWEGFRALPSMRSSQRRHRLHLPNHRTLSLPIIQPTLEPPRQVSLRLISLKALQDFPWREHLTQLRRCSRHFELDSFSCSFWFYGPLCCHPSHLHHEAHQLEWAPPRSYLCVWHQLSFLKPVVSSSTISPQLLAYFFLPVWRVFSLLQ